LHPVYGIYEDTQGQLFFIDYPYGDKQHTSWFLDRRDHCKRRRRQHMRYTEMYLNGWVYIYRDAKLFLCVYPPCPFRVSQCWFQDGRLLVSNNAHLVVYRVEGQGMVKMREIQHAFRSWTAWTLYQEQYVACYKDHILTLLTLDLELIDRFSVVVVGQPRDVKSYLFAQDRYLHLVGASLYSVFYW
jgi:hypothetical protein